MIPKKTYLIKRAPKPLKRVKAARKTTKRPKVPSISKLIKEADSLFSKKVRMIGAENKWSDSGGIVETEEYGNHCYTCRVFLPVKKLHCSHFLSRYYKAARWNFDNCRPGCYMCNIHKRGDLVRFRQNLLKEIGEARVHAVEALRDAPLKLSREYLETLIKQLTV